MASKNKTYIQKALDTLFKPYEDALSNFRNFDASDIENLRKKANAAILNNESEYKTQVEERLQTLANKIASKEAKEEAKLEKDYQKNFEDTEVSIYKLLTGKIKLNKEPADKAFRNGKVKGLAVGLATVAAVSTISVSLVSCGNQMSEEPTVAVETTEQTVLPTEEAALEVETIDEKEQEAIASLNEFSSIISENTSNSMNSMLANGVRMVDFENLTEDQQKDLIAGMGLQYYLVANIDDITTLEYANFMQEQPEAVADNDDLLYNFRVMNELLRDQIEVCTSDNKIDFSNIYQNELDTKLLNDAVDILARFNTASTKKEQKEISKEFYSYVYNLVNNTNQLQYSNSALATFINSEFAAWKTLTKSSGYGYGYYPDDELEAELLTVISKCGMSNGEKANVNIADETKMTLESINITRVSSTLKSRKENIPTLVATEMLYYSEDASYGNLKQSIMEKIDLSKYHKLESYEDKKTAKILATKPQTHANDSRVANGHGGTIANSQFQEYGINPSNPNAKQQLEEKVQESYKETIVNKNSNGDVIDSSQAEAWAKQGAIDANNGTRNSNVPSIYQDAYSSGWNAANSSKQEADKNTTSSTTYEEVKNGSTTETITDETYEGFKGTAPTPSPDTTIPEPSVPDSSNSNNNIESNTTFVPVTNGETTETVIEETTTGFADTANAAREIQVGTLTREEKIQTYKDIKDLIQMISDSFDDTLNIYDEMENHMSK